MEMVGECRGSLVEMQTRGNHSLAVFSIPARGLIGLRTRLLNATQGTVILHHRFADYQSVEGDIPGRGNGVMVSTSTGRAVAFALGGLQQRADMFVAPGDEVYEGMIVGMHNRDRDMDFNICIRTMTINNNEAVYPVGGGIVWDSKTKEEHFEAQQKANILEY